MKLHPFLFAATLALATAAHAGGDDHHSPRHGGIFVPGKVADVEVVAKPELVQVYVYDHGKPFKLDGANGKLTLLNGKEKTEAELTPAGDRMEARGSFKLAKGTKGIAAVTAPGKATVNARFELK